MKIIAKLSIAFLLGASVSACSDKPEVENKATKPESAITKKQDSHEGHSHTSPAKKTELASNELFQEGVHYRVLETPFLADNNQIHEFFWYGCPACKATEPLMQTLKKSDKLKVAVSGSQINEKWIFGAAVYEAFKHFNILEKAHPAYFEARQNGTIKDQTSLDLFLTQQGINPAKFQTFLQSKELQSAMNASYKIERKLKSTGVPTLVVGGKYVILNRGFHHIDEMQKAVKWLSKK